MFPNAAPPGRHTIDCSIEVTQPFQNKPSIDNITLHHTSSLFSNLASTTTTTTMRRSLVAAAAARAHHQSRMCMTSFASSPYHCHHVAPVGHSAIAPFSPRIMASSHQHQRCFQSSLSSSPSTSTTSAAALAKTSKDGVVGHPIDFDVHSKIEGNESQIVTITLEPGQVLRAESGAMMYMTNGVEMNTTTGGGMSDGFRRMMTGNSFFISDYSYTGEPGTTGTVALGTDFPSKIMRLDLGDYGGKVVCQKGALLCASHTVDIEMEFTKSFSGGFFGGEGFVLQALMGEGDVFLKAGGTLIRRDLAEGEELRISSGCLVGFTQGIDYDVQMVKGFKNVFAGGEGLFMTTLTGPGVVWLQGQPPQRMVSEIARRVPSGGGIGLAVPIGGGGGGGGGAGGDGGSGDSGGSESPQ